MQLGAVFLTGLLAGGASCAAVQGGLLTGLLARRGQPARTGGESSSARDTHAPGAGGAASHDWRTDAAPVGAFLTAKLVSHAALGALLGALGDAVQLGYRTRAVTLAFAGVVMLLLALHLLGVRRFRFLVPQPPAALGGLIRRSARSQAVAAPAVLGLLTVFIPCGVTLSVAFLAVASGSALGGMLLMTVFVLGTVPLFAVLGYAAARSAGAFGGRLAKVTAVVVLALGLYTLNSGLALGGAPVTAGKLASAFDSAPPPAAGTPSPGSAARLAGPQNPAAAAADQQAFEIEVLDTDYRTPATVRAGVPTVVTLVTNGVTGCTRGFVIPSLGIEKVLPERGRTEVDLGQLEPGRLEFTCSMGMYGGVLDVVA